jgi:hypothetical protein
MKKVSIKTGMLATDLGYRDSNDMWLFKTEKGSLYGTNTRGGISGKEKTFKQPTQTELQSWLRKKGIDVYAIPTTYEGDKTYAAVLHTADKMEYVKTGVKSYEKAIELGLKDALLILKQKKNG